MLTSIVVAVPPTASVKLAVTTVFSTRSIFFNVSVEKPFAEAVTVYLPTSKFEKR